MGMGIGKWRLGIGPNPQSSIPIIDIQIIYFKLFNGLNILIIN